MKSAPWPALALLAGCTAAGGDSGAGPTLTLLTPQDGDTVCGQPLRVQVQVDGMALSDPYGATIEPGTGHLDIALNGQEVLMTDQQAFDIEDVADGVWQLTVELSQADHTPVEPYVGVVVSLTVDNRRCD